MLRIGAIEPSPKPRTAVHSGRYKRRWKVERLFAWLYNFRRLLVRYEYHAANFLRMVHLGCAVILLRQFVDGFKLKSAGTFPYSARSQFVEWVYKFPEKL